MSGPKTSRYTLTAEQRRFLMEQLRVRNDRLALQQALAELSRCASYIGEHAQRLEQKELPKLNEEIAAVRALLAKPVPNEPAAMHELCEQTHSRLKQTLKMAASLEAQQERMETQVARSIARDIGEGFSATLEEALANRQPGKAEYAQRLRAIQQEAVSRQTAEEAKKALEQLNAVSAPDQMNTFAAIAIIPLERKHRQEAAQYEAEREAYALLASRYAALCRQLAVPAAPQPWHPGAMAALEKRAADMEQQLYVQEEQRRIRQALDEVMVEMGYALLGEREVQKRSGARFHHALYTFGDGTAVDVTYDANGQIAMELGGLDEADRLPDAQETAVLCRSMEEFCTSFEEFEERLAARGVVLKERISHLPPAQEHAQIINVQDYQLSQEAMLLDVQCSADVQRRKRQYLSEE